MSNDRPTILDPDHPINQACYASFLHWAIGEPEMRDAFRSDTGIQLDRRRTPIEAMIDAAAGYDHTNHAMVEFVRWATGRHWGWEYAPTSVREALDPAIREEVETVPSEPAQGRGGE